VKRAHLVLILLAAVGPLLAADEAATPLPVFTDVTEQAGIRFKHSYGDHDVSNIVEGTGAGAIFFDYDGDGYLDIYFVNGAWSTTINDNRGRTLQGKLSNALYRNDGDGTFTDVTVKAGVGDKSFGFGASAADYDADGIDDGELKLFTLEQVLHGVKYCRPFA